MPRVYNTRHLDAPLDAVYVGRGTPFGNPFLLSYGKRKEVIQRFEEWIRAQPVLLDVVRQQLRGKDLVCWCYPLACHADVLLKIANEEEDEL